MVDGFMPTILAEAILSSLRNDIFKLSSVVDFLEKENPLNFPSVPGIQYSKYKIKDFLRHLALRMNSASAWMGEPNIYEHYPVLKDGEQIIYFTDNVNYFLELLLQRAYIVVSNKKYHEKGGKLFLQVNFGIGLTI